MATKNIVPRTGSEGEVGTSAKPWSKAHIDELTSSIGVSASYFYGDGSSLTGIAAGWDGQLNGDAGITGSLTMTGSSPDFPQLHIINSSGSHIQPDFTTGMSAMFMGFAQEFVPGTGIGIMGSGVESSGSSGERAFLSTAVDANGTAGQMAEAKLYVTGVAGGGLATGPTEIKVTTDGNIDARSTLADYYRFTSTDSLTGVYVGLGSSATTGSVTVGYPGAAGETRMTFKTSNNATGETDRMTLDHDGNFGIGTTTPTKTLDVVGNVSASQEVSASSFWGDGAGLTNLSTTTPTIEDVLTAGNVATTPFTGSGIRVDDIGNTTLSITANSGDLNLSSSANVNLDLAGGDFKVEGGRMTVGTSGVNVDILQKGNLSVIGTATLSIVSSSVGVSGAFFQGDGSGLTNLPAASWDGQLNGDAGITGSLDVSGSSEFGNLSTDTHQFTGSMHLSGGFFAGTEAPEENHQFIGTVLVDAAGTNNSELIIDGPNPNFIKLQRSGIEVGKVATDGFNFTIYGGNSSGNTGIAAVHLYDNTQSKALTHFKPSSGISFPGTDSQVNISSSAKALRCDTNSGNNVFTVEDATTSFISGSGDLLTMDDTSAPSTPSGGASLYAKSGQLYTKNDDGIESLVGQELIAMSKIETINDTEVTYQVQNSATNFEALEWSIDGSTRYAKVTFTAPANGQARVVFNSYLLNAGGTTECWLGLHNSSTTTTTPTYGWFQISKDAEAASRELIGNEWVLTGLTPGASITVYVHATTDSASGMEFHVGRQSPNAFGGLSAHLPKPTTLQVYTVPVTIDVNPT